MKPYDHIIVDGRHTLFRVAATMSSLGVDTLDGLLPTGAIYGFIKVCLSVVEKAGHEDTRLSVCWEGGAGHRRELYPDYKRNRVKRKDIEAHPLLMSMDDQETIIKALLRLAGWEQYWSPGYEADDVMATLAHGAKTPTAIYTGDHDLHQCVTEHVHVLSANNGRKRKGGPDYVVWDLEAVEDRWGVPPANVPDVKALEGDTSDNIPGCPGVGKVWARRLLQSSPLVEDVIKAALSGAVFTGSEDGKEWKTARHSKLILENVDTVLMSKSLATIVHDVPLHALEPAPDRSALVDAFKTFHFASFLRPSVLKSITQLHRGEQPCP